MLPGGYIGPQSGAAGAKCACSGTAGPRGLSRNFSFERRNARGLLAAYLASNPSLPRPKGVVDMRPGSATIRPWGLIAESWKLSGRPKPTLRLPPGARRNAQVAHGRGTPDSRLERAPSRHARSSPGSGDHEPDPAAVVPLVPTSCTVCRTRAPVENQHCRPNANGAYAPRARRLGPDELTP
jgi:hypothetical protein